MAYLSKAVFLPDAAMLVAESLRGEGGREAESQAGPRLRHGLLIREARYELVAALRDGAIEAEGEHVIAPNDRIPRIEIRKVSRVWWAQAVVEPPLHVDLWRPGHVYVMWSGDGGLVIGPGCSPPSAGHVIDGATGVRRISVERETLLTLWPIAELSREQMSHSAVAAADPGEGGKPGCQEEAWQIAFEILSDDALRPARGHGRLMTLARLVNAGRIRRGRQHREDDTIRRWLGAGLREWEAKHPDR